MLVFNTCTIREKPDQRFAAHLAQARALKERKDETVIAVGGCYAEAQRERLFDLYPFVDVAFGPGRSRTSANGSAPAAKASPAAGSASQRNAASPALCRCTASAASRPGCRSRWGATPSAPIASSPASAAARSAVGPATSSPRSHGSPTRACARSRSSARTSTRGAATSPRPRTDFGELLRACDAVPGIERIRFTSPHPKDFREPVIAALAECEAVCEHVHLPLQSGSSRILKAMRRTYDRDRYLRLVEKLRAAVGDLALGTDIIVGFPGETEEDFAETLAVVQEVRYDSAYTFVFSPAQAPRRRRCASRCRRTSSATGSSV